METMKATTTSESLGSLKNITTVAAAVDDTTIPLNNGAKTKLKDSGILTREDFDGGPVSLDEIEPGLYLGNLTAATHMQTLKSFNITYILTLDSVPLSKHITDASFLKTKFIHIADMPKEDILHHLDDCVDFINEALNNNKNILVHCYFGVSRSSAAVIAFVMKKYNLDYQQAYDRVKTKRRFVLPNPGFITQLKLYGRMGCTIDINFQKYKFYRLRLAGEQVRKAKILPQSFNNVIKLDPAVTQENPEPIVYRCRKCRRILASKSHVLVHQNKNLVTANNEKLLKNAQNSNILSDSNTQIDEQQKDQQQSQQQQHQQQQQQPEQQPQRLLDQIAAQIRKVSLGSPLTDCEDIAENKVGNNLKCDLICRQIVFVEPIAWMKNIVHNTQGRLNCPKCDQKVGNFSWINGCQCPCGEEVSPAFYLIPSRIELSKAVQNVQTTI